MKIFRQFPILFLCICPMYLFSGCTSRPVKVEKKPEAQSAEYVIKYAPDWVNRGSRYSATGNARFFYGVSSSAPVGDLAQQKSLSDDGARAKVALLLSYYLNVYSRRYLADSKADVASVKSESAQPLVNAMLNSNMASVRITGSWRDAKTNTVWSIAELDLASVKNTMAGLTDVDAGMKDYFDANAEKIFDRIVAGNRN